MISSSREDEAPALRQVPPWRGRVGIGVARVSLWATLLWVAVAVVVLVAEHRAPVIEGRLDSATPYVRHSQRNGTERGTRFTYSWTDPDGVAHSSSRELVTSAAKKFGTTPGDPVHVRLLFGRLPLLEGAPDVYPAMPFIFAGMFLLFTILFGASDRSQRKKIELSVRGRLARGEIGLVRRNLYRGTVTLRIRYRFDVDGRTVEGQDKIVAASSQLPATLGRAEPPTVGERVEIAYAAEDPSRNVLYALADTTPPQVPSTALAPLPRELSPAPRDLPSAAPGLTTELPAAAVWVIAALCLLSVLGPLALLRDPESFAPGFFTFAFVGSVMFTFFLGAPWAATSAARRVLRDGTPLGARVTEVRTLGQRVFIHYVAEEREGVLHGSEPTTRRRLAKMAVTPRAGDTVFLTFDPERPWERAIWGFAVR